METEAALVESLQQQQQQQQPQSQSQSQPDSSPPPNNSNGNGVNGRNDAAAASKAATMAANQAHLSFRRLDYQTKSSCLCMATTRSLVLSEELC